MNAITSTFDLALFASMQANKFGLPLTHAYNGAESWVAHLAMRRGGVVTPEQIESMAVAEFCDAMGWPHPDGPVVDVELVNTCDGCGAPDDEECVCFMMNEAPSGWALKGAW